MENNIDLERSLKRLKTKRNLLVVILVVELIIITLLVRGFLENQNYEGISIREQEIDIYNYEFEVYGGIVRGSKAKALCDKIKNHNLSASDASQLIVLKEGKVEESVKALTEGDDLYLTTEEYINSIKLKIMSGKTYKISFEYDPDTGMITTIGIEEIVIEEGENTNVEQ